MALSAWVTCRSRLESRFVHGAPARICVRTGGGTVHGGRPVLGASDRHQAYQGARAARGAHVLLSGRCHGPRRGGRSDRPAPRSWAVWPYATRTQGPNLMRTRPVNHRIHGGPSAGKGGDRHGGRPMDLRHRRVLRTLRLGHRDGGTPVEGARRSATEALSENPSEGCETDALTQDLCRLLPLSCDAHVVPAHPPPWGDSRDHPARADCSDCAQMVHAPREVTGHRVARPLGAPGARAARRARLCGTGSPVGRGCSLPLVLGDGQGVSINCRTVHGGGT
jgi:hypothetical protein